MEPNIANGPKDLLVYYSRHLELHEIMNAREVCKRWRDIIDDPNNDGPIFKRFVTNYNSDTTEKPVNGQRYWFNRAKKQYISQKAMEKFFQHQEQPEQVFMVDDDGQQECCRTCNCADCCRTCCDAIGVCCTSTCCIALYIFTCCCCCRNPCDILSEVIPG